MGDAATVIRATLAAGDAAIHRLAFEEAVEHYGTALTTLDRTPPDADVRYRVLTSLGRALTLHADVERAQPFWLEAADIAQRAGDAERMFSALLGYSHRVLFQHDRHDLRLLDGLLRLLPPGDSPLRASALGWSALALMRTGQIRPPEDSRMADDAVAMARRTRNAAGTQPHSVLTHVCRRRRAGRIRDAPRRTGTRRAPSDASPGTARRPRHRGPRPRPRPPASRSEARGGVPPRPEPSQIRSGRIPRTDQQRHHGRGCAGDGKRPIR